MRHDESRLQQSCVRWFRLAHPKLALNLISIPNGYQTSATQARIAKAEGLVSGAADLFLFYPSDGCHGLAIEMKTEKGRQSETQKEWQKAVEDVGYKYIIIRSIDMFILCINNYLHVRER
jgi:hypothetical protein